jgi:hypothetical protein
MGGLIKFLESFQDEDQKGEIRHLFLVRNLDLHDEIIAVLNKRWLISD